ncbi:MAG TPA: cytochrome c [Pyrinomonadaceae bacterium]|nr:cytochrome c [Pyrinomonadaceae bacterium]
MSKSEKTYRSSLLLLILTVLVSSACRYDMQDQPKIKPLRGTTFFSDGLGSRQPIQGTVPRGFLRTDTALYTGKRAPSGGATTAPAPQQTEREQQTQPTQQIAGTQTNAYPDAVDTFPFPITKEIVQRGRERYAIFCSACHGLTGNGDGMIVRRGFRRAASFNDDRLRQAPVGHFFDAITNGWGAMPAYNAQIPVQDRWAIIAYVRALQLSQQNLAAATASPSPAASPTPTPGGQR